MLVELIDDSKSVAKHCSSSVVQIFDARYVDAPSVDAVTSFDSPYAKDALATTPVSSRTH